MAFLSQVPSIPTIYPQYNIGAMFDHVTGRYILGDKGQCILNGGIRSIIAVGGPPNSFKTTLCEFFNMQLCQNYAPYGYVKYCDEGTSRYDRTNDLAKPFPRLRNIEHGNPDLPEDQVIIKICSDDSLKGDEFIDLIREQGKEKVKAKGHIMTTPFIDSSGKNITIIKPNGVFIDSLTYFGSTELEKKFIEENLIGSSENNTFYLKDGILKTQLLSQMPNMCSRFGLIFFMTAHVKRESSIGQSYVKEHKLQHAKKGYKYSCVGSGFDRIPTLLLEIFDVRPLDNNVKDTGVLYPSDDIDKMGGCKDLSIMELMIVRSKIGGDGIMLQYIFSKEEGILPHLSQFHFIKDNKHFNRFGIGGNRDNWYMDLLPDVALSRVKVRSKIDENPLLRRAIEFTSDLLQLKLQHGPVIPEHYLCTPLELYTDIKALGYDWNELLTTRNHWVPVEYEEGEPHQLTIYDLLRMRKQEYVPYWKQ